MFFLILKLVSHIIQYNGSQTYRLKCSMPDFVPSFYFRKYRVYEFNFCANNDNIAVTTKVRYSSNLLSCESFASYKAILVLKL